MDGGDIPHSKMIFADNKKVRNYKFSSNILHPNRRRNSAPHNLTRMERPKKPPKKQPRPRKTGPTPQHWLPPKKTREMLNLRRPKKKPTKKDKRPRKPD